MLYRASILLALGHLRTAHMAEGRRQRKTADAMLKHGVKMSRGAKSSVGAQE